MSIVGDARIDLVNRALDGLSARQQAIAGNIANVDTPGYKRRDVDFESSLQAYLNGGPSGTATFSSTPSPSLLRSSHGPVPGRSDSLKNDGNDVDVDYEMTELSETQLRYELLSQAAASRFSLLHDVIGRP